MEIIRIHVLTSKISQLTVGETRGVFHKAFFFVINDKNVNNQFFFVIGGKLLLITKLRFIKANDKSRSRKCILIVVIEPNNKILSSA